MSYMIAALFHNGEIEILKQIEDKKEALIYGEDIAFSTHINTAIYEIVGTIDKMKLKLISFISP